MRPDNFLLFQYTMNKTNRNKIKRQFIRTESRDYLKLGVVGWLLLRLNVLLKMPTSPQTESMTKRATIPQIMNWLPSALLVLSFAFIKYRITP